MNIWLKIATLRAVGVSKIASLIDLASNPKLPKGLYTHGWKK
jgi:hypothetical protein